MREPVKMSTLNMLLSPKGSNGNAVSKENFSALLQVRCPRPKILSMLPRRPATSWGERTVWFSVGNGGMDPYSSPYKIPNNSLHNPFSLSCYEPDRGVLLPSDGLLLEAAVPKPPGRATLPEMISERRILPSSRMLRYLRLAMGEAPAKALIEELGVPVPEGAVENVSDVT